MKICPSHWGAMHKVRKHHKQRQQRKAQPTDQRQPKIPTHTEGRIDVQPTREPACHNRHHRQGHTGPNKGCEKCDHPRSVQSENPLSTGQVGLRDVRQPIAILIGEGLRVRDHRLPQLELLDPFSLGVLVK